MERRRYGGRKNNCARITVDDLEGYEVQKRERD